MRKFIISLCPIIILLVVSGDVTAEEVPIAFIGGVFIDSNGSTPIKNGVVVVRDGIVAHAGPQNQVAIPGNARIIDISGV